MFHVLNTPEERRQRNLDEDLKRFPYVNGTLFEEPLPPPSFDSDMRGLLVEACEFSWESISPAIFGSLFQSVMNREERRAQGAHYTTEKNILKVIQPLFLDELREEFAGIETRRSRGKVQALEAFQDKLASLKFFDPACGCGNFLIISYRELRALEIEVLKELRKVRQTSDERIHDQSLIEGSLFSKIDVTQFYGIELGEFPARIAEVALWMMDHIMNNKLSLEFGEIYVRIPLKSSPHILHADALETDWRGLLAPSQCSYVFGNPPFGGSKFQTAEQRAQVRRIADLGGSGGSLDYVAAWFLKAGEYIQEGQAKIGFVATNSITQGEQVAQLWPVLFDRYRLEIAFAHRTFGWGSDARGKAHVHVVIVGLSKRGQEPATKRLFSYEDIDGDPTESQHEALTPYLFGDGNVVDRHLVVHETSNSLCVAPKVVIGSKPIDGGHYIFTAEERAEFLSTEPGAEKFMRPYIGSHEYLNGGMRWILALQHATPQELRRLPKVQERITAVRKYRLRSKSAPTRQLAETPMEYHVTVIPEEPYLVIPEVSSERREYVPIGWLEPPTIASNLVKVLLYADLWHFGILTSAMTMAWLRHIGGRLESRYRYSIGLVYNTFPWPEATEAQKAKVRELAQAVLDARARYPEATFADLYDPDLMKADLRKAHRALDVAVDKLYRAATFKSDRERVEHLFGLYERLVTPLVAGAKPKRGRRKAKK
jgi:hypothetical protein